MTTGADAPQQLGLIVAVAKPDGAIGRGNALLFNIKEDMRHFVRTTKGHAVIMGRKTFESIGKALPKRHNVVLSRTMPETDGVSVARTPEEALAIAHGPHPHAEGMPFVIGGGEVYRLMLPHVTHVVLTEVDRVVEGADAFFSLPSGEFDETERAAAETEPDVEFVWLERRT